MAAKQYSLSKRLKINSIKELRQNTDEGSTLEIIFDLKNENGDKLINYKTAQNLAMFPENTLEDTESILNHISIQKSEWNKKIFFEPNKNLDPKKAASVKYPFSEPYSIFEAV